MSNWGEIKEGETGDMVRVACAVCDHKTKHKVVSSIGHDDYEVEFNLETWEFFETIVCQGCESISCRLRSGYRDAADGGEREEIYPPRLRGRKPLEKGQFLPSKIRTLYNETHKALCSNLNTLSAVGIRALVESLCLDKGVTGNLETKINALRDQNILTPEGAQILHKTRFLGNRAAHEIERPDDEALNTAMEVVEHTLKSVYILPKIAKRLPTK